jgi:hypothetical protein
MVDQFLRTPRRAHEHGYDHEARILRDRQMAHEDAADRAATSNRPYASARQLVQVYNGGSMPNVVPRVYFTHPVLATGVEIESGFGTLSVDITTTVPVIVLGHVPSVGDDLIACAVGGRWVAELGLRLGAGSIMCMPCAIPVEDLMISWTNLSSGNGSTIMTYATSLNQWATGCIDDGILFHLACTEGEIELQAIFFTSGVCPTGESNYCSNLRSAPLSLTLSGYTCSPFSLTFTVGEDACPTIYSFGNTEFVITL